MGILHWATLVLKRGYGCSSMCLTHVSVQEANR